MKLGFVIRHGSNSSQMRYLRDLKYDMSNDIHTNVVPIWDLMNNVEGLTSEIEWI